MTNENPTASVMRVRRKEKQVVVIWWPMHSPHVEHLQRPMNVEIREIKSNDFQIKLNSSDATYLRLKVNLNSTFQAKSRKGFE